MRELIHYFSRYQVKHEALQERFVATADDWLLVHENLIIEVKETAKKLEKYNQNVDTITGAIISTVASAIILGFILLSSMLSTLLIAIGVGTVLGLQYVVAANITRASNVGNCKGLKEVQKQLDEDDLHFEVMQQMAEDIQLPIKKLRTNIQVAAQIDNVNMIIAKLATSTPFKAAIQVGGVISTSAVGLGFIGVALGLIIVLILINSANTIQCVYSLSNAKANRKAIQQLNKLVVDLQGEKENIRKKGNKFN